MNPAAFEIANFCMEENTFGALLLTGDWGCGKTYLLEHDLPDILGDSSAIIRISLFGETSVEAIRKKIQKAYLNKLLEMISATGDPETSKYPKARVLNTAASNIPVHRSSEHSESVRNVPSVDALTARSANDWIYKVGELSGLEKMYALNPSEYIKLEPKMLGRVVILIFDDLERCHLSQAEILGCINEYCENLHLKTIIVANEEKIKDWQRNKTKNQEDGKKDYLAYSEIKEKIIVKTVKLTADYGTIITNIIEGYRTKTPGYVDFLRFGRKEVASLVDDCETKNIRSLRCGFQDFEKVYALLVSEDVPNPEILKYFTSFVLFEMLAKAGRVSKSPIYGYVLNKLAQKYPGHYSERHMPNCMKDWVLSGAWTEGDILQAIRENQELMNNTTKPENLIRSMNLMELDDETIQTGWSAYLNLAYRGLLTPEEYVRLIRNMISAREYNYVWPIAPDMTQLKCGVKASFRMICEAENAQMQLRERLDEFALRKCTESERKLYSKIVHFHDSKAYLYGNNRNRILTALRAANEKEIFKCRIYDTDRFDAEMCEAVVGYYLTIANNQKRIAYIDLIKAILRTCSSNCSHEDAATLESIRELRERILVLRESEADKPLKTITTNYFLEQIDDILEAWDR